MSKLKQLALIAVILIPCFGLVSSAAENSKKMIKDGYLDLCDENVQPGTRTYVKGVVSSVKKDKWSNKRLATITEGTQGCELTIEFNSTEGIKLRTPGNRVKSLIKVEREGRATLLNNNVTEAFDVVDQNGQVPKVEYIDSKIGANLLKLLKSQEVSYLNADQWTSNSAVYEISKELTKDLKTGVLYRWYYQTSSISGNRVVVNFEPVNQLN